MSFSSPGRPAWSSLRLREMTALVKASSKKSQTGAAWAGGQLALSDWLASHLRSEVPVGRGHGTGGSGNYGLDSADYGALAPLRAPGRTSPASPPGSSSWSETCRSPRWQPTCSPFLRRALRGTKAGLSLAGRLTAPIRPDNHRVGERLTASSCLAPPRLPFAELVEWPQRGAARWRPAPAGESGSSINLSD